VTVRDISAGKVSSQLTTQVSCKGASSPGTDACSIGTSVTCTHIRVIPVTPMDTMRVSSAQPNGTAA
jgi:hypothetical protein